MRVVWWSSEQRMLRSMWNNMTQPLRRQLLVQ